MGRYAYEEAGFSINGAAQAGFNGGEAASSVAEEIVKALAAGESAIFRGYCQAFAAACQSFSGNLVMADLFA